MTRGTEVTEHSPTNIKLALIISKPYRLRSTLLFSENCEPLKAKKLPSAKQDHADHNEWETPPFWIDSSMTFGLIVVGVAYTLVAWCQLGTIDRQTGILQTARRARRLAASRLIGG
jgi:hypothetical protein